MGESILFPWSWSVCFFDPHLPVIFLFRTGHLLCVLFKMPLWPNLSINMWHLMSAGLQGSHYGQWIWAWQRILGLRYLITSGFTFSLPTRWATHLPSNYIAGLFPNPVFRGPFDPLASLYVFCDVTSGKPCFFWPIYPRENHYSSVCHFHPYWVLQSVQNDFWRFFLLFSGESFIYIHTLWLFIWEKGRHIRLLVVEETWTHKPGSHISVEFTNIISCISLFFL